MVNVRGTRCPRRYGDDTPRRSGAVTRGTCTREFVVPTRTQTRQREERVFDGIGRTALVSVSALVGCGLLIAVIAALIMAWNVHPLLTPLMAIALIWVAFRMAGLALT